MKNKGFYILLIFGTLLNVANAKTLKILAIGNSYSEDAIEQYFYEIAKSHGDSVVVANMYIGGATLERHYNNSINNTAEYQYRKVIGGVKTNKTATTLSYGIKDEDWDIITLQQSSGYSGIPERYSPFLKNLVIYVKNQAINTNLEVGFHMTWAWSQDYVHGGYAAYNRNQMTMYNAIIDATEKVIFDANIQLVIPVGTAIQNGRTSLLGDTFNRDGSHLNLNYGRYTVALTWYGKIFGKPVLNTPYKPTTVTSFEAKVAQHAAQYAIQTPYAITSLADLTDDNTRINSTKVPTFSFFPNPAKDKIIIDTGNENEMLFTLYSFSGQTIKSVKLTGIRKELDVRDLRQGTYFLTNEEKATILQIK